MATTLQSAQTRTMYNIRATEEDFRICYEYAAKFKEESTPFKL